MKTVATIENKTETNQKLGAEILVETLIRNGADTVFGYPGSPVLPIYEALSHTKKIKHYLTRHEQGAVHAAEGYAAVKKDCGIALVTSGPGITNTVTGLANALFDKTPLLVICAQTEKTNNNDFQSIDVTKLTESCTKKTYCINKADDISKTITNAIQEAKRLPQGPVVVAVTKTALSTNGTFDEQKKRTEIKVEAPQSCILRAIDKLKNAKRPLIIVGGGCKGSESAVKKFAEITHIPVVNTLKGCGIADNISCGMIGLNGVSYLNKKIKESDVVLALGTRFTDRTTAQADKFLPDSHIISINIENNNSDNVEIQEEILGEMKVILQQMIGTIIANKTTFEIKFHWIEQLSQNEDLRNSQEGFTKEYVLNSIFEKTKLYSPVVVTDVGEHQVITAKTVKTSSGYHFLTSGGFGAMGYGLPAAIGASVAKPDSLVLNITGDGSFQMNMQELAVCAEYNLPIKIIILNNSSLGMIKNQQKELDYQCYQSDLINPDFVKIANAYGIFGYNITNREGLNKALAEFLTYKKPVILNIKVDK